MFVTNVWRSRFGVFGYHFGRAGRCPSFRDSELARLARLTPNIKLAQALSASQALPELHARDQAEGWGDDWGLSAREREATKLLARGLQNREIAALLESPRTRSATV